MEVYVESDIDIESSGFSNEEFEDVKRCLKTLLSIRAGSLPLSGDLGIDYDVIIDCPANIAKNMLAVEIIEKVNTYEPRVKVTSIEFDTGSDGQLIPHIYFIRNDEYEEAEEVEEVEEETEEIQEEE